MARLSQEFASSKIQRAEYETDTGDLVVRYQKGGAIYVYHHVTMEEWNGLVGAASAGSYMAQTIERHFEYERLA